MVSIVRLGVALKYCQNGGKSHCFKELYHGIGVNIVHYPNLEQSRINDLHNHFKQLLNIFKIVYCKYTCKVFDNISMCVFCSTRACYRLMSCFQEYSVQLTFREQWLDERLKFNNLGGERTIRFN